MTPECGTFGCHRPGTVRARRDHEWVDGVYCAEHAGRSSTPSSCWCHLPAEQRVGMFAQPDPCEAGRYRTPQTWPEGAQPTPGQALDWLRACQVDEGREALERLLTRQDRASRCFVANHDGEIGHLRAERDRLLAVLRKHYLLPTGSARPAS